MKKYEVMFIVKSAQDSEEIKKTAEAMKQIITEYNGKVEPIYFTAFMDVFFESPCTLYHTNIDIDKIPSIDKATFNEITEKRNNSYETSLHLSSIINNTLFSHIDINQFPLLFTSSINDKQFDNAIMEYLSLSPEQSIIDEIDITFYNAFSTIPSLTLFEEINRQYHYNTITEYNHLVENIIPTSLFQDFQYQRKFCIVDLAVIFSLFENAILNKDKVQITTIMLCTQQVTLSHLHVTASVYVSCV